MGLQRIRMSSSTFHLTHISRAFIFIFHTFRHRELTRGKRRKRQWRDWLDEETCENNPISFGWLSWWQIRRLPLSVSLSIYLLVWVQVSDLLLHDSSPNWDSVWTFSTYHRTLHRLVIHPPTTMEMWDTILWKKVKQLISRDWSSSTGVQMTSKLFTSDHWRFKVFRLDF